MLARRRRTAIDFALPTRNARRLTYGAFALALLGLLVAATSTQETPYWVAVAGALAPDAALLLGIGRGLARGQIHPRAVPLYNGAHRFWGPAAVGAAAVALASASVFVVALAWAFHVALDRAVGYGLRTRDGFQRG